MKKYFLIGILMAIVPNICFGASARFTQLAREKERKMAELEKCMGSTKGLKIAGISTLGLSAVGVAANVVEAKKIKDYDSSIESTQQQIEKTKTEIDKKTDELQKKSLAKQTNDESTDNYDENDDKNIVGVAFLHNGKCRVYTSNNSWKDLDKCPSDSLNATKVGEWGAKIGNGQVITGISTCASNGMDLEFGATGTPNYSPVGVGEYCWCKINSGPGTSNDWILSTDAINGIPYKCENYCAQNCASAALNNSLGFSNTPTESKKYNNSDPKSNEGNSDNPTNSDPGSGNRNSEPKNGSKGSQSTTKESPTSTSSQTLLKTQCEESGGKWDPTRHNDEDNTIPGVCVLPEAVLSDSVPSGAQKITDPNKMLQNVITQDIAAIKNTPGKLGDKIYIHGYTISNIQHLSLHDNLYNAIEEFKNRCYDNAGDPDDAYSVIVGIDEDALGDDSDEKYTENTVLQNLEQHIVSRCECNDYDWERQGNKCVKRDDN